MTLYKPTLQVKRLRIARGGSIAYDELFHPGVNIICGNNSAGKTTILDCLAYGLGAENIAWKPEALLCDSITVEVLVNGTPLTLRRPINTATLNPMLLFWGEMQSAIDAPASNWEQYPFRRSASKESFSQILFRALEMPEVRGAAEANITMHQLLRLLYVDQHSPHTAIFRAETFDTILTRETTGNYLFGIYDDDLYEAQLKMRVVESSLDRSIAELRSIFSVLGRSGQETNFEWISSEIKSIEQEQINISGQLLELKRTRESRVDPGKDPGMGVLRTKLSEIKRLLATKEDRIAQLEFEIKDSSQFVSELQRRVESLDESSAARDYLGSMNFSFCPSCLSPITTTFATENCGLCKTPLGDRAAKSQLLRMKNELELQREESTRLLSDRETELMAAKQSAPALRTELRLLEREYANQLQTWNSAAEAEMENLAKKLGQIEQQLRQLAEYQKLGQVVADLQAKRATLTAELDTLKSTIEKRVFALEQRKAEARHAVSEELIKLLKRDLPRQVEFRDADHVDWSFSDNKVIVNDRTSFSESSMVILRHSFHLAMLFASTKKEFFRLPRFLILDGIEDGGLELERSYNFQKLIVEFSEGIEIEHQIIYGTSQIEPSLDAPDLVVGRHFTPQQKSLNIQ